MSPESIERTVTGFRVDTDGDWVAVLDCHHGHHARHDPPWQERSWTQTEEGRQSMVGTTMGCPKCVWIEVPDGLVLDRSTTEWDEHTLPAAIRRDHRLAVGVWGSVRVLGGSIRFRFTDGRGGEIGDDGVLQVGMAQPIPPGRRHHLEPIGPTTVVVDFFVVGPA
jgi:tellurite methyltransferase